MCRRCDLFAEGRWETLVDEAAACVSLPTPTREAPTDKQKAELACRKVRLGEVFRVRLCLTGSLLAPGTEGTWQESQSKRSQQISREFASAGSRVQPRHTSGFGSRCFLEKSQNCAQRFVTGSWRGYLRAPESFDGRSGHTGTFVLDGDSLAGCSSSVCCSCSHHSTVDSARNGWESSRHCYWLFLPTVGRANSGETVRGGL